MVFISETVLLSPAVPVWGGARGAAGALVFQRHEVGLGRGCVCGDDRTISVTAAPRTLSPPNLPVPGT